MEEKLQKLNKIIDAAKNAKLCTTQKEFAALIGMSENSLSKALNGLGGSLTDSLVIKAERAINLKGVFLEQKQLQENSNSPSIDKCLDIILAQQAELERQNASQRDVANRLLNLLENKKGSDTHASLAV